MSAAASAAADRCSRAAGSQKLSWNDLKGNNIVSHVLPSSHILLCLPHPPSLFSHWTFWNPLKGNKGFQKVQGGKGL